MNRKSIPIWFWLVAGILLLWNLMGVMAFIGEAFMTEVALSELSTSEQQLYADVPLWTKIVYGIAVLTGTIACVGLFMRRKWTYTLFIISLIAVLIQMGYSIFLTNAVEVLGNEVLIMPIVVIVVCIVQVFYSKWALKKIDSWNG